MKPMKTEYFECACYSDEHQLIFHYDPEEGDLWVDVHLRNMSWYKRIWQAIKHVFGYKCKYGCFDTWALNSDDIGRMIEILQKKRMFEEDIKRHGNNRSPTTE